MLERYTAAAYPEPKISSCQSALHVGFAGCCHGFRLGAGAVASNCSSSGQTHRVCLNAKLLKRLEVLRPRLGRVVGYEDDLLAEFTQMLQRLLHTWDNVGTVVNDTIAIEKKRVRRVQQVLVLLGGLEYGWGHDERLASVDD